ncbi:MAG: hypothetical protein H6700_09020 [Myxococcales bacterium]|nr:hypothetical protein [Myxococcales bacterium]
MSRFSELLTSLEDAAAAAARLEDKLDRLVDGRPPTPLVRGAILAAADELAAEGKRCQTARPRDVIEDEWTEPVFVSLREAIHTASLAAAQRPHNWDDWVREVRLATREMRQAWARFDAVTER